MDENGLPNFLNLILSSQSHCLELGCRFENKVFSEEPPGGHSQKVATTLLFFSSLL